MSGALAAEGSWCAAIGVRSDVEPLRRVVVHRPGDELRVVHAGNAGAQLFDGAVRVEEAQREHDRFTEALRSAGAEVEELEELLADVLCDLRVRREVLAGAGDAARAWLSALPAGLLARGLVTGRVAGTGRPAMAALPNMLFARDVAATIGGVVHVGRMACAVRSREAVLAGAVARHHPRLAAGRCSSASLRVEGGDVAVAGPGVVVVGVGPRTTSAGASQLAQRLFAIGTAHEVVVAVLPPGGPFHLDLAVTMVDAETLLADRAIVDRVHAWRLRPGRPAVRGGALVGTLAAALGTPKLRVVAASPEGHGRGWDRGANVLAVRPGAVVAYADNRLTNGRLRRAGVEVLDVPAAALGAGRGGPRCLTWPLLRGDA